MRPVETLTAAQADAWDRLGRAVGVRRRTIGRIGFATISARGGPSIRMVVLRAVDPAARRLEIHTDIRSVKVAEIRDNPAASLVLHDPGEDVQIRVEGRAGLLPPGPHVDEAWAATPGPVRTAYRMPGPPGAWIADPALPPPSTAWTEEGRENFAVIALTVDRIDWVHMVPGADRRALFDWTGGDLEASWLIP